MGRRRKIKVEEVKVKEITEPAIKTEFGSVCFRPDLYLDQGKSCSNVKNIQCSYFDICKCEHLKFGKSKK